MGKLIRKTEDSDDPIYEFPVSPNKFSFPYKRYSISWFDGSREFANSEGRYDNSWDWLIPVVEKIEGLNSWIFDIYKNYVEVQYGDKFKIDEITFSGDTKIEAVFKACISFIKWYNDEIK